MFKQLFTDLWALVKPPRPVSWQTLLLCSLGLWLASFLMGYVDPDLQQSFATWGMLLLTLSGIFWAIVQKPLVIRGISMGPWLAAVLVSTFIYRYLNQVVGSSERDALYIAMLVWPLIAALLKIIPDLVRVKPRIGLAVKPVHRTGLAIFLCSNEAKTIQPCAEGSANPSLDFFHHGQYYGFIDFCSVNLVARGVKG